MHDWCTGLYVYRGSIWTSENDLYTMNNSYSCDSSYHSLIFFGTGVTIKDYHRYGNGIFTSTCPPWLAECVDAKTRAVMVAVQPTNLISGTNLAFRFNYGMSFLKSDVSWRFPFAFQIVFSVFAFALAFILPDSLRWLQSKGRIQEPLQTLSLLRDCDSGERIQGEYRDIFMHCSLRENLHIGSVVRDKSICLLGSTNLRGTARF